VCDKCNGTGKIPSTLLGRGRKGFYWCECHEEPHEYYPPPSPDDFDFPCSDTFRGFSFERCNLPDPQPDLPPQALQSVTEVVEHIHRHSDIGKREFQELKEVIKKVDYLEKRTRPKKKVNFERYKDA